MISSIVAIDNIEDVLVVRVNDKGIILHIVYYNRDFDRSVERIIGKTFRNIGLEQTICEQCEAYLHKVFINVKEEIIQLHFGNKYYQISYLPEWKDKRQVETVLIRVRDITREQNVKEELRISQAKLLMAQKIAMLGYFERYLECILEHASLKAVAQQLFIHHNTVKKD